MELKVWVDGTQRCVCGVNSTTTCQDVVFALAHATGQTGRFTLMEKWRNSERLLAPSERPMDVLSKWGEYSNDVQFVMKRSQSDTKVTNGQNLATSPSKRVSYNVHQRSLSPTSTAVTSSSDIKKECIASSLSSGVSATSQPNSSAKTVPDTNGIGEKVRSRPPHPPPYREAIAKSALRSQSPLDSGQSPHFFHQESQDQEPNCNNKRRLNDTPSPINSQKPKVGQESKPVSPSLSKILFKGNKVSPEKSFAMSQTAAAHTAHSETLRRDAIKLVNLQKETIVSQRDELMQLDDEILYLENMLREEDERRIATEEETRQLERIWIEQEAQITKLEQQRYDDELDILKEEEAEYRKQKSEITLEINQCDSNIASCRQKIQVLTEELDEQRRLRDKLDVRREMDEREIALKCEEMKLSIREKSREIDIQKEEIKRLQEDMKSIDELLDDKLKQIDLVVQELKEANLQGLSLSPPEEFTKYINNGAIGGCSSACYLHGSCSGCDFGHDAYNLANRPGSTRKIVGSPRELENAAPTYKNPHGIWV